MYTLGIILITSTAIIWPQPDTPPVIGFEKILVLIAVVILLYAFFCFCFGLREKFKRVNHAETIKESFSLRGPSLKVTAKGVLIALVCIFSLMGLAGYIVSSESSKITGDAVLLDNSAISGVWHEFNSVIGSFKVLMPTTPQYEKHNDIIEGKAETVPVHVYVSTPTATTSYIAAFVIYPKEAALTEPDSILEMTLNESLKSTNSTLVFANFDRYRNYPAITFRMYDKTNDKYYEGRYILFGYKQYQLFYTHVGDMSYSEADYNRFMDSFEMSEEI